LTESRVNSAPTLLGFKVTAKVADQVRTPPALATIFIYPE
jgi:hypothetical protein